MVELIPKIVFVVAVVLFTVTAAVVDMRTRRLPNWLTVTSFLAGIGFHVVLGLTDERGLYFWVVRHSLLGALVGFAPLFILYLIGGGGAGDAKLITAIGAWLGPTNTFFTYVLGTMIGVGGTVMVMMFKASSKGMLQVKRDHFERVSEDKKSNKKQASSGREQKLRTRRAPVPLGVAFAIGTWLIVAFQIWMDKI